MPNLKGVIYYLLGINDTNVSFMPNLKGVIYYLLGINDTNVSFMPKRRVWNYKMLIQVLEEEIIAASKKKRAVKPLPCLNPPGWVGGNCINLHLIRFSARCRKCKNCKKHRGRVFVAKALDRRDRLPEIPDKVWLWQFTTPWLITDYNLRRLREAWRQFTKKVSDLRRRGVRICGCGDNRSCMHEKEQYDVKWLVYAIESGTKGDKLHIHVLITSYVPVHVMRHLWNQATGIPNSYVSYVPNRCRSHRTEGYIDYKGIKQCDECTPHTTGKNAIMYVGKYISEGHRYYWLGEMLKVGSGPQVTHHYCHRCNTLIDWMYFSEEKMFELKYGAGWYQKLDDNCEIIVISPEDDPRQRIVQDRSFTWTNGIKVYLSAENTK